MFVFAAVIVGKLLVRVYGWLVESNAPSCPQHVKEELYRCLKLLKQFIEVIQQGISYGIQSALSHLDSIKYIVIPHCLSNARLMNSFSKLQIKIIPREILLQYGIKKAVKYGAAKAGSQAVKRAVKVANPGSIAADFAQAGLEVAGYEEAGKTVGALGNIGTGAVAGAMIGGPVGAAIGGIAGLFTWTVGEVVGNAFSNGYN